MPSQRIIHQNRVSSTLNPTPAHQSAGRRPIGAGPIWPVERARPMLRPRHVTHSTVLHAPEHLDVDSRRDDCHSRSTAQVRAAQRSRSGRMAACMLHAHSLTSWHAYLRSERTRQRRAGLEVANHLYHARCRHLRTCAQAGKRKQPLRSRQQGHREAGTGAATTRVAPPCGAQRAVCPASRTKMNAARRIGELAHHKHVRAPRTSRASA